MPHMPAPGAEAPSPESLPMYLGNGIQLGDDEFEIMGEVTLASKRLYLLDVGYNQDAEGNYGPYDIDGSGEKRKFDGQYVLVTDHTEEDGRRSTRTFAFNAGQEIEIGRSGEAGRALGLKESSGQVSRKHASLIVGRQGTAQVRDTGSMHGTKVRSAHQIFGAVGVQYSYTAAVGDQIHAAGKGRHLERDKEGWGFGEYGGRPIIARDTPINGGIYPVGGTHGEALVVDDAKYPELSAVYETVLRRLHVVDEGKLSARALGKFRRQGAEGVLEVQNTLETVLQTVSDTLRYDLEATQAIARDYEKVSLGKYVRYGVGVCRTQGVLSAYIAERLIKDGHISGAISVDRNSEHTVDEVPGGHAWARFRSAEDGEVYIIDPAQHYVGKLRDVVGKPGKWDYRRSEDLMQQVLRPAA